MTKIAIIATLLILIGWGFVRMSFDRRVRRIFDVPMLASIIIVTFGGFLLSNIYVFLALCAATFFIKPRSRDMAALVFVVLVAFVPNVKTSLFVAGSYIADLRPITAFSLSFGLILLFTRNRFRVPLKPGATDVLIFILFVIFAFGSSRAWTATSSTREVTGIVLSLLIPYLLFTRAIGSRQQLALLAATVAAVGMMLTVIAVYEARFGWSVFDSVWNHLDLGTDISRNLRIRAGLLRAPTTFNESTSFAVFQGMALFAALASRRYFRSQLHWIGGCTAVALGLLMTQSRGALIAAILAYGVVLLYRRSTVRSAAFVAAMALAGVYLVIGTTSDRVEQFTQASASLRGEDYRQQLLHRGIEEGMKHFWLGDDLNRVIARMPDMVQGEHIVDFVNTYLVIFVVSGIIGLTAVLAALLAVYARLWRSTQRDTAPDSRLQQTFVVGGLTAVAIALFFTSFYERNPLWLICMLSMAKILVHTRPEDEHAARAPATLLTAMRGLTKGAAARDRVPPDRPPASQSLA